MQPRVVDISHHNTVQDLHAAAAAGVWGVIHKASEGNKYRDPDYAARRGMAEAAGMLWGAYHFNNGSDVRAQVDNFLAAARPGPDTLLVLDFEDNPKSNMSISQAVQFLRLMEQRVGHKIAIYSGNRIKETIGRLSAADRVYVCEHPLWLCQYGPRPKLPMGFTRSFLWQYSDGRVGPGPHGVAGIKGDVDLNAFNGTREELTALWSGPPADVDMSLPSSHSSRVDDDQPDSGTLPPFMRPATGGRQLNVQTPTAQPRIEVEVVQRELDAMGYHEVGSIDGRWGGKTAAAIKAFFTDRSVGEKAGMGPLLNNEIAKAKRDGWSRPIAPERANATPTDIAPKVETVRVSLLSQFWAKIAAGGAAVGLTGSSIPNTFQNVQEKLQPVQDMFNQVPGTVWFLLMLITAGAVWYATSRAAKAATNDYNTGRLN